MQKLTFTVVILLFGLIFGGGKAADVKVVTTTAPASTAKNANPLPTTTAAATTTKASPLRVLLGGAATTIVPTAPPTTAAPTTVKVSPPTTAAPTTVKVDPPTTAAAPTVVTAPVAAVTTAGPSVTISQQNSAVTVAPSGGITTAVPTAITPTNGTNSVPDRTLAGRIIRPLGQTCDPSGRDPNLASCGVGAYCERTDGCRLGICTCLEDPAEYRQLPENSYDCFKVMSVGDMCLPTNATQARLMPDGAICSAPQLPNQPGRVTCSYPIDADSSACSVKSMNLKAAPGYQAACDNTAHKCNAAYNHSCIMLPNAPAGKCDCQPFQRISNGICSTPGYGEDCDNDDQCSRLYGLVGANRAICAKPLNKCVCYPTNGFVAVSFTPLGQANMVTICLSKDLPKAGAGQNCTIGIAPAAPSYPLCGDGLQCYRCPEFNGPPAVGQCLSAQISSASTFSQFGSFFVLLLLFASLLSV